MKNFGEVLKRLRKQHDMTQEQLAEYLNISSQSVSKWETNVTLPDITLIPVIANIFDVSADVLLGIDIDAKEKRVQEILSLAWDQFTNNDEKEMEILRSGLKEFPNDFRIMHQLLHTPIESAELIKLAERILDGCTKDSFRHTAIRTLCIEYAKIGEIEKAKQMSCRTPFITECYEFIMEYIGSEQEKAHQIRDNIFTLMEFMAWKMVDLKSPPEDYENLYMIEEKIAIREKVITMVECLTDGNRCRFGERAAWAYLDIGEFYTELGEFDKAIENLRQAAEYVIAIDSECDYPDKIYTALFLRGKKYSNVNWTINMGENYSLHMLNLLNKTSFDSIRECADFVEIKENLMKICANKIKTP
jgi:Predicted transcriptional regulators